MSTFELTNLRNSSVWGSFRISERIEMDPVYQRESDIWNLDKKQLLIDTIINQFDIPKIYLHKYTIPVEKDGSIYEYAVIDGKQRLNAIWGFIKGDFSLATDFVYLREGANSEIRFENLTYLELSSMYPHIKTDFDSYLLDIVCIETDDVELIEELFSRLNESVPLSAPEKRNALPGRLPQAVRELAAHPFFGEKLPFGNKRYRHYDLLAKMLLIEHEDDVCDLKKVYLDAFFESNRNIGEYEVAALKGSIVETLNRMYHIFEDKDKLLRQVGMIMLYFYVIRTAYKHDKKWAFERQLFSDFDEYRIENKQVAEADISSSDYDLLEFDRYTQSPNDAYAMRIRLEIFDKIMLRGDLGYYSPKDTIASS